MQEIQNYNAGVTMCQERSCDKAPMYYDEVQYYGLRVHIALCEKHANQAEKEVKCDD